MPQSVIPAKAGISGEGAGKEPHGIPAFAGMTIFAKQPRSERERGHGQRHSTVTPTTRQFPSSRSSVTVSTTSALLAKRVRNFTTS